MDKTLSVNIGGFAFHIDEPAYQDLMQYLEQLKSFFSTTEGKEEILGDIKTRIAELLKECLTEQREVVTQNDVRSVIATMGEPEEYMEEEEKEEAAEQSRTTGFKGKRFYRDIENKLIGGVSAGFAAYVGIDPIWIRLIFILLVISGGSGILIYLILWLIVPAARTTAEVLQMRGEPVTAQNIGRYIKSRVNVVASEIKTMGSKKNVKRFESEVRQSRGNVERFLHSLFGILSKVFAGVLLLIGIAGLVFTFLLLLGVENWLTINEDFFQVENSADLYTLFFTNTTQHLATAIGAFIILGTLIVAALYHGIKILLNLKVHIRYLGWVFFGIGIIGLITIILPLVSIAQDFTTKGKVTTATPLPISGDTLYVDVADRFWKSEIDEVEQDGNTTITRSYNGIGSHLAIVKNDSMQYGWVIYEQEQGLSDKVILQITRYARAGTAKPAILRAENIVYQYTLKDSALRLSSYLKAPIKDHFRGQHIKVLLQIPKGKTVKYTTEMRTLMEEREHLEKEISIRADFP